MERCKSAFFFCLVLWQSVKASDWNGNCLVASAWFLHSCFSWCHGACPRAGVRNRLANTPGKTCDKGGYLPHSSARRIDWEDGYMLGPGSEGTCQVPGHHQQRHPASKNKAGCYVQRDLPDGAPDGSQGLLGDRDVGHGSHLPSALWHHQLMQTPQEWP